MVMDTPRDVDHQIFTIYQPLPNEILESILHKVQIIKNDPQIDLWIFLCSHKDVQIPSGGKHAYVYIPRVEPAQTLSKISS